VVRQLRLRDIGGIIVIDFIDMARARNRDAVLKTLRKALDEDRTKTFVVEISPLGLVEMTRQNVTDGPREVMTKKCPTCGGDGIVVSEHTAAVDVERRLRSLVTPGSRAKAFKVEVSARVAWLVAGSGGTRLRDIEETTKRRFFLIGKEGEHLDHFKVLEQGTLEKVAPALPVDVDQEVEVKLGEVGLHDPHAGVGKIDDVDVVVGGAAKLVGKKVTARVTALTEGLAWAELLAPVEQADEPLTAEAEAERPTRAKKSAVAAPKADEDAEPDSEEEDADADAEEGEGEGETADGESPAKKKTRRGSRGGRNRKKKPVTAAVSGADVSETVSDTEVSDAEVSDIPEEPEPDGPVIHMPDRELGTEDGDGTAPAKKRTRRGSRGGKNRRKKPAGETATATATIEAEAPLEAPAAGETATAIIEADAPPEAPAAPAADDDGERDWGYTPMSEWGLDDSSE
jgi:ribonuclease G